jgi:ribosomal protein S18 acetylase RimI-like enzyme
MIISLRSAVTADSEFCFQLHKAAMGGYVTAVWGWDEQVQRSFHARAFDPAGWQIICADGSDAGVIAVDCRPGEIYLSRIELLPAYQGRGIGTGLVRELIGEAGRRGQQLALDVLAVNQRARALYQRLGLREAGRHGEGGIKIAMRSGSGPPAGGTVGLGSTPGR